jgi:hypothetical protein
MSPYAKLILFLCDENLSVNLKDVVIAAYQAGFDYHSAKAMCLFLGVGIRDGS